MSGGRSLIDSNACTQTDTCSNPLQGNGTACTDNDACTQTDTCQTGLCMGANPVLCGMMMVCTAGVCM